MIRGSVSHWIESIKTGDEDAIQRLWERYFERLVAIARHKLGDAPRRAVDEEDVALSAFASLCQAARRGRFPDLTDRHDLWRLLVRLTAWKAVDRIRHESRAIRGGGRVHAESDLANSEQTEKAFIRIVGDEPTPEFAAMMAEECEGLLELLGDELLRVTALRKMEGYSNAEIAELEGCSVSTIERCLRLIRKKWEKAGE